MYAVSIVGAVYLVGYMQWSVAWLIGPVVLSVLRDQWRRENEYRRNLAKVVAVSSEKDVDCNSPRRHWSGRGARPPNVSRRALRVSFHFMMCTYYVM
ncbi:unnamed protein product [Pieris macdunnoughi]|uniref:Uncharacterized protein n=1 Tax=Pieris macdunnoughi TaxID=345717 RepID=A0A821W9C0_9NEOP|nr:unnamed protein product [Pieris macdunnoughi]